MLQPLMSQNWRLLHIRLFFYHPRQSCFHQCTRFPQDWSEDLLTIPLGFYPVVQGFLTGGLLGSETGPRGLSAVPVSSTMGLPLRWILFAFCLYRRSFAELGSGCAWPLPRRGCFSQVISESRHHRCRASVCFSILCLLTTKIWSDGH